MTTAIARARTLRVAPRKARLIANLIKGKKVPEAMAILEFTVKGAAPIVKKVLAAAVANAEYGAREARQKINPDNLVVQSVLVDGGPMLKRFRSAPRGRAVRIRKRTSHIRVVVTNE
jgi:large subunit ribosomal protein L22